jgi:hypothetical protein
VVLLHDDDHMLDFADARASGGNANFRGGPSRTARDLISWSRGSRPGAR